MSPTPARSDSPRSGFGADPDSESDPLEAQMAEVLVLPEGQRAAAFEALCAREPGRAPELRERWRALAAMGLQSPVGAGPGSAFPEVLGDFRLLERLGAGGMGVVYRARQQSLGRDVALKLMRPEGLFFPRSRERFRREVEAVARLKHPGIVPVHSVGEEQGIPFFAMELLEGAILAEVLSRLAGRAPDGLTGADLAEVVGAAPEARARGIFAHGWNEACTELVRQVAEALQHAHELGILHRDVKPSNIALTRDGRAQLFDFGLAATREVERLTHSGGQLGTLHYMSPEQLRGTRELDARSDVYALGVTLYELLALEAPFRGEVRSQVESDIFAGRPTPLRARNRRVAPELELVCAKAMAPEPQRRYASARELAAELQRVLERRPVLARAPGVALRLRRWTQRNPALAVGSMAAVGLFGVAPSLLLWRERNHSTELTLALDRESTTLRIAETNERLAREETAKVLRLSDVKVLQDLLEQADALWPPHPDRIGALEAWLERARALVANLDRHRAALSLMRVEALPWSEEDRARDRETHPEAAVLERRRIAAGLVETESELERGVTRLEGRGEDEARAGDEEPAATSGPELARLIAEVESRRTWRFGSPEEQWQHDVLAELIAHLEDLQSGLLAEETVSADHGWSMLERLSFARRLEQGFAQGSEYAQAWAEALPAIEGVYPGLDLQPQIGLLPLGPDPQSGLWEFAHLMTGELARRAPDGRLRLEEETGVVLVLLPGESFWMGAQKSDPTGRNYDPQASADEGPVHEVELSAFFLSKYELTQGQWQRLTGRNPSYFQRIPLAPTLLHPVEMISWQDCMTWLPRAGLALPSEAQWEYGARAGTDSPWWTGPDRESLREQHAANLADQAAARAGAVWTDIKDWPELDDGYAVHAPVGTYAPNDFGLHEVAGNMWELCLDGYDRDFYGRSPGLDPVAPWKDAARRVYRGGAFGYAAILARSASRDISLPSYASRELGVRPARAISQ